MNLEAVLQDLYDSEINVTITMLWDIPVDFVGREALGNEVLRQAIALLPVDFDHGRRHPLGRAEFGLGFCGLQIDNAHILSLLPLDRFRHGQEAKFLNQPGEFPRAARGFLLRGLPGMAVRQAARAFKFCLALGL